MNIIARVTLSLSSVILGVAPASAECEFNSAKYSLGAVVRQDDHFLRICTEQNWQLLVPSAQISVLSATWGSDINSCEYTNTVGAKCNGQLTCGLSAIEGVFQCNVHSGLRLVVGHICKSKDGEIPGSAQTDIISQGQTAIISCSRWN